MTDCYESRGFYECKGLQIWLTIILLTRDVNQSQHYIWKYKPNRSSLFEMDYLIMGSMLRKSCFTHRERNKHEVIYVTDQTA